MKQRRIKNEKAGFTIIETLVSLAIFASSILGLIVITSQGAADTNYAKNKLVASYLAQEGIEMVRNMRDSSSLAGNSWQATWQDNAAYQLSSCYATGAGSGCDIDPSTLAIAPCSTASQSGCAPLRYDLSTGMYRLNASNPSVPESPFSRLITVRDISPNEVAITSTIYWMQGATPRNVSVNEDLFDWVTITPTPPVTGQ